MTSGSSLLLLLAATAVCTHAAPSLLQTWGKELDNAKDTPITRVVKLLDGMKGQLGKEMDEDEEAYDKLACWCNTGSAEKGASISESESKIADLTNSIEALTAKSAGLVTKIKETEDDLAANKQTLAQASALREKQLAEFHDDEQGSIQAVENIKAAIVVLGKHGDTGSTNWHENDEDKFASRASLLSIHAHGKNARDMPWGESHESRIENQFDDFMRDTGIDADAANNKPVQKFLQAADDSAKPAAAAPVAAASAWSPMDSEVVQKAMQSARSFVQARNGDYMPSYSAKSGEILGVMKQLKEEMEADLSDSQKTEQQRSATFAELRDAKTSEIAAGEKMAETKEDELADTNNALAEAKEDLGQTQAALSEFQKFLTNLTAQCAEADKNFAARKAARMDEISAVSQTIEILTADEARDAMSATYSFLQVSNIRGLQHQASVSLRSAAAKLSSPELAVLATSVELDSFAKVKKAIDDMVSTLKIQQADEVKKNDWCKDALQENEMTTAKTTDHKADLEAKIASLEAHIVALGDAVLAAHKTIDELQVNLQRASVDRRTENSDFQKTVADQRAVQEVLAKALDKLANFYDKEEFAQTNAKQTQTPPKQAEYKASAGATGVMSMIEKLIHEAKALEENSRTSESEAQGGYESLVEDTNASVADLQTQVVTKTGENAQATKDKIDAEGDLMDTVGELEGLSKGNGNLHSECDYLSKNFDTRQAGRSQEIEALQQAKQILSGASQ